MCLVLTHGRMLNMHEDNRIGFRTHLVKDLATWLVRPDTSERRAEAVTSASYGAVVLVWFVWMRGERGELCAD